MAKNSKPKIQVGSVAPDFQLKDQEGNEISLKDLTKKSPVVLYFYPKAMTPGCTIQARGIRDASKKIKSAGVTVVGVSPDHVDRLCKFTEKEELNFPLLSDEDHAITEKYGIWQKKKFMGREFMGVVRTTFIIGKDGKIKHVMDKVNTKTHHDDVIEWIKSHKL